ncbi:MAG: tripartite tricarboxylate transporter permease [Rhodobacteraceae bacterium]|nr:tripartite tricarboxylate transporter permease [Paracoccaceae bacterium]
MGVLDYIWFGILSVFGGPELVSLFGLPVSVTLVMILAGFLLGIMVGATPGLAGPMAMAVALPLLISAFGYTEEALLPVMGFLIGVMKGATVGGAVPAILFNTPGTPDAYMTTLDGYPLAQQGKAGKALRVAHLASVSGDTFSDLVLFVCAPFLAILVERYLDLPEKTALLILSLSFIATVMGGSAGKGLISAGLGLLAVSIGSGEDFYPRLSLGTQELAQGFPISTAVLGVLILGAVFKGLDELWQERRASTAIRAPTAQAGDQRLHWGDIRRIAPYVARSAVVGTAIGALPGIGSTLAATLGYTLGKARHRRRAQGETAFGKGAIEGIAATEAANSSVSGANLIPVLSLGIPGNAAAVFLLLAADSIGGFNPGPSVFTFTRAQVNPELVIAFGLFTAMALANLMNWTIGGLFMRLMGGMARIPRQFLLPSVLLLTLSAIYVQETRLEALWFALGFGVLGYVMRLLAISPLPFVIAFILGDKLEATARQAYAATGGDPLFLFTSPLAAVFMALAMGVIFYTARKARKTP